MKRKIIQTVIKQQMLIQGWFVKTGEYKNNCRNVSWYFCSSQHVSCCQDLRQGFLVEVGCRNWNFYWVSLQSLTLWSTRL